MATVEATTQRVQRMLADEFNNVRLSKGGFALEHGTTAIHVEVKDWGKDQEGNPRSLVQVWSPLARDVPASSEMYHWAATAGQENYFGGVTVLDREDGKCLLIFDHTLLGDYIDPAELYTAIYMVGFTADEMDDLVVSKFGGKRYSDE